MKLSATALALLAAVPAVLAGLEDAKYSTVLSAKNFDGVIASQSEGTLVAFFAPWCGHCKSLEPVWTKIASAFDGDDRCKVAHLDADDAAARPLASKYGVSGFPTIKFIQPPSKGGQVEQYSGPRTEEAFLEFSNEKCGTHKLPGGLLSDLAGRIPSLDSLASLYLVPTATRPDLLSSASALASSLTSSSSSPLAAYYVKIMTKLDSLPNVEEAKAWIEKERARLAKLAAKKGSVTAQKIDEARMKSNILAAFASSASASVSSAASVASASGSSVASVASASASSASAVVSSSASSASSVVSSAGSVATDSASSVYSRASETVESVVEGATETAKQVVDKVKGEL